jgi:hypothetical protein
LIITKDSETFAMTEGPMDEFLPQYGVRVNYRIRLQDANGAVHHTALGSIPPEHSQAENAISFARANCLKQLLDQGYTITREDGDPDEF